MRKLVLVFLLLAVSVAPHAQTRSASVPTPDSVFGFAPGADYKLATYDQSIEYFKKLAGASRYIKLLEAGKTTQGRTMYFALISTPENLAKLDRHREIWQRLAHPQGLTDAEAQKLASEGKTVTIMTPMGHIAPYMHFTLEAPNMHRKLHKLGVEIVTYHMPTKIEAGSVTAAHVYDADGHERTWEADATVLVTQRRSNEALFRELKDAVGLDALAREGVDALYRIGDCEAPRLIADAVFSGHRLAREIDTDDPAVPLPFKRERRVPGSDELEHDLDELRARRDREAVPA